MNFFSFSHNSLSFFFPDPSHWSYYFNHCLEMNYP
jgi:hypothetical protein